MESATLTRRDFEEEEEYEEPRSHWCYGFYCTRLECRIESQICPRHYYTCTKRQKKETLAVDRISSLPDSILLHILSLLPSTVEAVRTGTLSKRWQYLWKSVPSLSFSDEEGRCDLDKVAAFVDKTLIQCRHHKLEEFKVRLWYEPPVASQLNLWIRYAVSCKVERLELNLDVPEWERSEECFKLPEHLFTNSFLTILVLVRCIFKPNAPINWKAVQSLSLCRVELSESDIENISLGSSVLETLELKDCNGFRRLHINSASLKKLVLSGHPHPGDVLDAVLEISAPNILSLVINEDLEWSLVLLNMASLVEANLDFDFTCNIYSRNPYFVALRQMCKGLLQSLCHVNELKVGNIHRGSFKSGVGRLVLTNVKPQTFENGIY